MKRRPKRCPKCKLCKECLLVSEAKLSPREVQIVKLVAVSASNMEIGAQLEISKATVTGCLVRIFRKLRLDNRVALALWAVKNGLTEDSAVEGR
jgi:DNA-binding CsgD family transcriptional regulator